MNAAQAVAASALATITLSLVSVLVGAPWLLAALLPILAAILWPSLLAPFRAVLRKLRGVLSLQWRRTASRARSPGERRRKPGREAGEKDHGDDDALIVWVPPGRFRMGSDDPDYPEEAPEHEVEITQGFWIMRCLVTNAQYATYLNRLPVARARVQSVVAASTTKSPRVGELECVDGRWRAVPGREDHPVTGADWQAANDYAAHYGMHLPTEAQWEYAARGAAGVQWPWGNRWDGRRCCSEENPGPAWDFQKRCLVADEPTPSEVRVTRTTPVTRFEANAGPKGILCGASWCGALDMAGNLMEWCSDWYAPYPADGDLLVDPTGPSSGDRRVVRGGNCFYDREHCRTTDRRHASYVTNSDNSIGFRCVEVCNPPD